MRDRQISPAPNYTNAALTMLGVNLMWMFLALWALFGLIPVLLIAFAINRLITLLEARRR